MKRQRAVMVAALAAGVGLSWATGVAAPVRAAASTPPEWNLVFQARDPGIFQSIAAISRTNVWAVAGLTHRSLLVYKPFIRRFNGTTWEPVTIRGARMYSDSVQATSARDVWVFGLTRTNVAASAAYRWDGARWHKIPVPGFTYLQGTVVLGPSNVWAFGGSSVLTGDIFHWNGRTWRSYNVSFYPQSISASSARNLWLTGLASARGDKEKVIAARWTGRHWRPVSTPRPVVDSSPTVTALSRSNVWIGWDTLTKTYAAHWNGHHWRTVVAPGDVEAESSEIVPDGHGGYWFGPFADWTTHGWISTSGISPPPDGGAFVGIAAVPGTSSFLMPAGVMNPGPTVEYPTIYRLDLR
jgi:hypothetical protein